MREKSFRNTRYGYGAVAISVHWLMALLIIGLYFLGQYMVDLDYYDHWYVKAPDLHRSIGVIVATLLVFRVLWRWTNTRPQIEGKPWERKIALGVHRLFYLLIAMIVLSGYLITTADGQAVSVFGWFDIPATVYGLENQEDIAGEIHELAANLLILMVVLHSMAALKHHFIDRDSTLLHMLRPASKKVSDSPIHKTKE